MAHVVVLVFLSSAAPYVPNIASILEFLLLSSFDKRMFDFV